MARLQVLLAALCFGTTGTAQALGPDGTSAVTVGAARIAIGALLLLAVQAAAARRRKGRRVAVAGGARWPLGPVVVGAVGVAGYQLCFFAAVKDTGVAVGTVVALGSAPALAGLGGALQLAREPANLATDLVAIGDAFVVVVVGGMGSITGAYLAAVIIAEVKAICIGIGVFHIGAFTINASKFTLVAEFLVMAVVLIARPYGLMGKPQGVVRSVAEPEDPIRPATPLLKTLGALVLVILLALPWLAQGSPYILVLGIDVLIAVIFAVSLHFIAGPGGMHSFGHAAYFGLGAYGAALLVKWLAMPMSAALVAAPLVALAGALLFGWFAVRLSGVYLAMLTLAFAQIVWATVFQWEELTGGSNGVIGVWPKPPFDKAGAYFLLTLVLAVIAVLILRRILFAPFGYAMRAGRDNPLRAEAIGIDVKRVHWLGFALAGAVCGVGGGLFAFAKGSISPETISVGRSIDGLVMVLLGGIQTLTGPIVGASFFATLQDTVMRQTEYWRALLGVIILVLVLAFPQGIAGAAASLFRGRRAP